MLLLLNVQSSDPYATADYDYAVVKIEEPEAKKLITYLKMFDANRAIVPELEQMTFEEAGVECEFYPWDIWDHDDKDVMPVEFRKAMEDKGYFVIPDDYSLPFTPKDAHAPDKTYLQVSEDGFWWHSWPQMMDFSVDTETVPREILSQVL